MEAAGVHATRAGLRDASGMGTARAVLDGLALPRGALGRAHGGGAPGACRRGQGDRHVRAGHDDRAAGAGRRGLAALRPGHLGAAAGVRQFLDPRYRADLRAQRRGASGGDRLAFQRLWRAIARICPGCGAGGEDLPAPEAAALCGADRARGRRYPCRRRRHSVGLCRIGARSAAQSGPRPNRGRSGAARSARRRDRDLAGAGAGRRRDRRPCRQPRLLRRPGRGAGAERRRPATTPTGRSSRTTWRACAPPATPRGASSR